MLNDDYSKSLSAKQNLIDKLKEQNTDLKSRVKKYEEFLGLNKLLDKFAEFIKPKSIKERLEINKKNIEEAKERVKPKIEISKKNHNVAI